MLLAMERSAAQVRGLSSAKLNGHRGGMRRVYGG